MTKMCKQPEISVVMAAYNAEQYIKESIESILHQTFSNFEFIIVNDCSTDNTGIILNEYSKKDNRIVIINNEKNYERCYSRNLAIKTARGNYIAILDSDDCAVPDRLEKQILYFSKHPEVCVLGGYTEEYETGKIWPTPLSNAEIRVAMLFTNPYSHSTVAFKKELVMEITDGYSEQFPLAEDYDLWERLSHSEIIFANIPDVLVRYKTHQSIDLFGYYKRIEFFANKIKKRQLKRLGLCFDDVTTSVFCNCDLNKNLSVYKFFRLSKLILEKNNEKHIYDQELLYKELMSRIFSRAIHTIFRSSSAPKFIKCIYLYSKKFIISFLYFIQKYKH